MTVKILDTAKLKALLEEKHITQRELAEKAGVTEQAMSRYVNGTRTPRLTTYAAMTQALGIGIDDLLTDRRSVYDRGRGATDTYRDTRRL